jgi:hypothetical protein
MESIKGIISELENKANKYENLKEENQKLAERIKIALVQIENGKNELLKLIGELKGKDTVKISIRTSTCNIKYSELRDEWYEKMVGGLDVSIDLIRKTYPDWNDSQWQYLYHMIRVSKNIEKRTENGRAVLFIVKER